MRTVRCVLIGVGNLGRRFCEILVIKRERLLERYGLDLRLVGAADSRGAAYRQEGLNLQELIRLKQAGRTVGDYPEWGRLGWRAIDLVRTVSADLVLDASPVNLGQGGEPGLSCIRSALERGMHVVTPNKGPIVLAWRELQDLANEQGVALRYDGTVAGGLPVLNIGQRDLRGALVSQIEAVPNLVTGYVMDMLAEGMPWEKALALAREEGVLEADAAWDLEGWDAAAKLVILANAILDLEKPAQLKDVSRAGIVGLEPDALQAALTRGERYRLLARATLLVDGGYALSVAPVSLSQDHPLGQLGRKQMGVVFSTDIYGVISAVIDEPNPIPSAATMLRDLLDIYV